MWIYLAISGWLSALSFGALWLLAKTRCQHHQWRLDELSGQLQKLQLELESKEQQLGQLREQLATIKTQLQEQQNHYQEKLSWVAMAQKQLQDSFASLSQHSLQQAHASFLTLAQGRLDLMQSKQEQTFDEKQRQVSSLVEPIRQSLQRLEQERQSEQARWHQAYGSLQELIRHQTEATGLLHQEARTLATALKSSHVRGVWGEIQLKRIIELAGMSEYCDFTLQSTLSDREGQQKLRPDLIVELPEGRRLAVDAKAPLKAYLEALEESSEQAQRAKLREHAAQLKQHVIALSQKEYWAGLEGLDLVILFIPGDTFLQQALSELPDLLEWAASRHVLLATPTSLIALLKSCSYSWHHKRLEGQLLTILSCGKELYSRLCRLSHHIDELRKGLEKSLKSYNELVGCWQTRVLTTARKLSELDSAHEPLEDPSQIDQVPRQLPPTPDP